MLVIFHPYSLKGLLISEKSTCKQGKKKKKKSRLYSPPKLTDPDQALPNESLDPSLAGLDNLPVDTPLDEANIGEEFFAAQIDHILGKLDIQD